jgi:nucleoid DNA-binding protein
VIVERRVHLDHRRAAARRQDRAARLRQLQIRRRRSRTGPQPKTGAGVVVPAKRVPHFKPGKELRELINRGV